MHTFFVKHGVLALVLAATAGAASAHRPWMLPTATIVENKEAWVTIDGAVSEGLFDYDHMPLRMDGVTVTGPDGSVAPAPAPVLGKLRSSIDLPLPNAGTYRIALVSNNVMGSYKVGNEVKRFRGSEADFARQVPAGDYKLVVEAAREAGGRELVRVPFTLPAKGKLAANAAGKEELGAVSIQIQ